MTARLVDWLSRLSPISGDTRMALVKLSCRWRWDLEDFERYIISAEALPRGIVDAVSPFELSVLKRVWRSDFIENQWSMGTFDFLAGTAPYHGAWYEAPAVEPAMFDRLRPSRQPIKGERYPVSADVNERRQYQPEAPEAEDFVPRGPRGGVSWVDGPIRTDGFHDAGGPAPKEVGFYDDPVAETSPVAAPTKVVGSGKPGNGAGKPKNVDDLFDRLDADRDGVISRNEFHQAMEPSPPIRGGVRARPAYARPRAARPHSQPCGARRR